MVPSRARPFPLRKATGAVSAVVGTILLVAITIVLAAILYVVMSGLMVETPLATPEIILDAKTWQNGSVVINILSVENAEGLAPDNLAFIVQAQNGSIYFSGPSGTNNTLINNITVNVTYKDLGTPQRVGPEDFIVLTVTPANSTEVRLSAFKVLAGGAIAGTVPVLS